MKKRWIAIVLALCMVLGVFPQAMAATTASTYKEVVGSVMSKCRFGKLGDFYKEKCRGILIDLNKDDCKELILQYIDIGDFGQTYEVWTMVGGNAVCMLEIELSSTAGYVVYSSNWDAADYIVFCTISAGSDASYTQYLFYKVENTGYRLAYTLGESYDYREGSAYSINGSKVAGDEYIRVLDNANLSHIDIDKKGTRLDDLWFSDFDKDIGGNTIDPFVDVYETDYYGNSVLWAYENNITKGDGTANTFNPNGNCTRAQVVTFLWRSAGSPEPKDTRNPFSDVKSTDYFYKPVLWAVENGITVGTSATTFGSEETCTRAQVATFLWRTAGEPTSGNSSNTFQDVRSSDYYYKAVLWAADKKITQGDGSASIFNPGGQCTRGQIVTFLYRFMGE